AISSYRPHASSRPGRPAGGSRAAGAGSAVDAVQVFADLVAAVAAVLAVGIRAVAAVGALVAPVGGRAAVLLEDALDGGFRDDALRVVTHDEAAPARGRDEIRERVLAAPAAGPVAALVGIGEQAGLSAQGGPLVEPAGRDQFRDVIVAGVLARVVGRVEVEQVEGWQLAHELERVAAHGAAAVAGE